MGVNNFIKSEYIQTYPCGNRNVTLSPMDRLSTEYNITSIVNRITDRDSFVITRNHQLSPFSQDQGAAVTSGSQVSLTFNIKGYLFQANIPLENIVDIMGDVTVGPNTADNTALSYQSYIYAGISVGSINSSSQMIELLPLVTGSSSPATVSEPSVGYVAFMDEEIEQQQNIFTGVKLVRYDSMLGSLNTGDEVGDYSSAWRMKGSDSDWTSHELFSQYGTSMGRGVECTYVLPILKCIRYGQVISGQFQMDKLHISVPEESQVKFSTTVSGRYRSVVIDDGVI